MRGSNGRCCGGRGRRPARVVINDATAEQLTSVEAAEILAIRRQRMRRVRLRWSDVGWRLRWVNQRAGRPRPAHLVGTVNMLWPA